ncbi:MAG TPA: bifunctional homocysteine S-methyltransferase/methylenetetrahydrofolate reductase [Drouetiella sp.]
MTHPFLQALKERPLLVDGATGTLLYSRGASTEASFEHLNLTRQDLVQQAHIDYINAGADVIETNSFSGNRLRLANFGLEEQVWKINVWAAKVARNAREVAGQPVFVAGSVGPTGKLLGPLGETNEEEVANAYQEQMEALLAGGVDLFMIETMSSLEETAIAVRMARKVSKLPVVAQLSFSVEGHTFLGTTPEDAVRLLVDLGDDMPDVFGINCGAGPGPVFDSLIRMSAAVRAKGFGEDRVSFSCLPNAGQPSLSGGRYTFMSRPNYCASYVEPMVRSGARLVGGCCGTTPEHIKAMREKLDKYIASSKQSKSLTLTDLPAVDAPPAVSIVGKSASKDSAKSADSNGKAGTKTKGDLPDLASRLREAKDTNNGDFYISVELDPPKGAVFKKLLQAAQLIHEAGADAINVGDSPMARVRMSSMATCQLISQRVGIDTIIHFTTRDRNLMGIQADLLGCQALGIKNVIALTGDPPALGNYVHATAVYDVDSVGLIKIISQLNQGQDIAGNSIGSPTALSIACALNPTHENRQQELDRCRKKIDAGAHFIMTQPLYQVTDLTDFLDEFGPLPIPMLVGIMPLHSFKHAEYLHNEVPGISIPQKVRDAMEKAGDDGSQVGLELAEELLEELRPLCQGAYLVPSFGRYEEMATLVRRLKAKSKSATPA